MGVPTCPDCGRRIRWAIKADESGVVALEVDPDPGGDWAMVFGRVMPSAESPVLAPTSRVRYRTHSCSRVTEVLSERELSVYRRDG